MEWFFWTRVYKLTQQRLASGVTSAQCIKTDAMMGEVNLAANEPMSPMLIDMKGSAEQRNAAVVIAAAHEDHGALEWGAEVELEALGKAAPLGGGIPRRVAVLVR